MRRISPPADRAIISCLVAFLWALAAVWLSLEARGQAPGPELFARPPQTPMEFWDAADYLIRTGQVQQAVPYLNSFIQSKPDDETLLAIRDRYGAGSILQLADHPQTRGFEPTITTMLAEAVQRNATRPDRINRFIAALTKTNAEQAYAVDQLRRAGPYAVPFLVHALQQPGLSIEDRSAIVRNMGRLDRSVVPPLIAALDSPSAAVAASVAAVLGVLGDPRAVPHLTYLAARRQAPAADGGEASDVVRDEARRAIFRLTGRPFAAQPMQPICVLVDAALRYHRHAIRFPAPPFILWTWDENQAVPVTNSVSQSEAEAYFGLRLARQALQLDPADLGAQVTFLSLALEKAVERTGFASFPASDPSGAFSAALAVGPEVLGTVVLVALADRKYDLAAVAVTAFGRVTDREALPRGCCANPLIKALTAPNRRVQFAAAQALVTLEPRHAFPGSSLVVPTLARFVTGQGLPRAVVIDGNTARGSQLVGYLKELGYEPVLATTGADGFRRAAESADVELILLDNHLVVGDWRLIDTLANLRSDCRTAGIPVYIVGPLNLDVKLNYMRSSFPEVKFLLRPDNAALLEHQLGGRPAGLSESERTAYARSATVLLARIAAQPCSPFEPELSIAEPALTAALNMAAVEPAAAALSEVAMSDAQRGLADLVLDPSKPAPVRQSTAAMLTRSIQRFGPLVAADQETRLLAEFDQELDPALRSALGAVLGALRPKPALAGVRLQLYGGAPAPAGSPVPATPEATSPASENPGATPTSSTPSASRERRGRL
jgi:HEAT repeat protein